MNTINKEVERHELEALLPWHANGTLNRRDAQRIQQALADDRELARRYELVREELAETIHLNETLGAPSTRAMEKLFAAIDAEEARSPQRRRSLDLGRRVWAFLSGLLLLAGVYLLGIGPLRTRYRLGPPASKKQIASYLSGVLVLLVALEGPIHELSDTYLFSAHMVQHMLLIYVAPPLLLLGIPAWLLRPIIRLPGVFPVGS